MLQIYADHLQVTSCHATYTPFALVDQGQGSWPN